MFVTIRNAKVISDSAILEIIKSMELNKFEELGAKVFVYGSTNSLNGGGQINDMEAFIVVKGRIGVKAPKLVEKVSLK